MATSTANLTLPSHPEEKKELPDVIDQLATTTVAEPPSNPDTGKTNSSSAAQHVPMNRLIPLITQLLAPVPNLAHDGPPVEEYLPVFRSLELVLPKIIEAAVAVAKTPKQISVADVWKSMIQSIWLIKRRLMVDPPATTATEEAESKRMADIFRHINMIYCMPINDCIEFANEVIKNAPAILTPIEPPSPFAPRDLKICLLSLVDMPYAYMNLNLDSLDNFINGHHSILKNAAALKVVDGAVSDQSLKIRSTCVTAFVNCLQWYDHALKTQLHDQSQKTSRRA